jgi:hypothetical protein
LSKKLFAVFHHQRACKLWGFILNLNNTVGLKNMSTTPARKEEEKWFVQTARVLAWFLAGFYALLWIGRITYAITHAAKILSWLDQHGLQSLQQAGNFLVLPLVPDFVIGIPMLMLFGFIRVQNRKKEANQASEPTLTVRPFSVTPSTPEPRPTTVVSVAHF